MSDGEPESHRLMRKLGRLLNEHNNPEQYAEGGDD